MKVNTLLLLTFLLQITFALYTLPQRRGFEIDHEEDETVFEYFTPNSEGWAAIGFGKTNTTQDYLFVYTNMLTYRFSNFKSFNEVYNEFKKGELYNRTNNHVEGFDGEGALLIGKDHFHFELILEPEFIKNYTYYFFYENTKTFNTSNPFDFSLQTSFKELNLDKTFDVLTDRAEVYNRIAYYVILGLHILACLLPFFLCHFKPLKSRGMVPFIVIFSITLGFLSEVRIFFYDLETVYYECPIWGYLIIVTYDISYTIPIVFYIRYFILIHLKQVDSKFYFIESVEDGIPKKKLRKSLLILKYLTHPLVSLFFVVIYYFLHYVLMTIILGSHSFVCSNNAVKYMDLAKTIYNLCIIGVSVLVIFVDVVLSIKKLAKCQLKSYFISEDPYFYRLEIFQVFPIFFIIIAAEVLKILKYRFESRILKSISYYYLIYIFLLFPSIITIFKLLKRCIKTKEIREHNTALALIFDDKELVEHFFEFTKQEWNQENALYYQEMIYKRKSRIWTSDEAKRVYSTYLAGASSILELNVPYDVKEKVRKQMESENYSMDVFSDVNQVVIQNLLDPLNRFSNTKEFKKFMNGRELKDIILAQ